MKTNTLIYIVIVLQILLIVLCFSCLRRMNPMARMSNTGMHMMSNSGSDMQHMMMNMTARMEGKTGDELDKIFLEDMIVHHQGAVDMAKELQKGTERPELQKMAKDIIEVQTSEITMMEKWLNEWFD